MRICHVCTNKSPVNVIGSVTRCGNFITTVVIFRHFWRIVVIGKNMEKFGKYGKIGEICHRGNFSSNVVISETGCGNFP